MTYRVFLPAIDGTQERLDELISLQRQIRDLLTPAAPEPESDTVELREPEAAKVQTSGSKVKRK